MYCRYDYIPPIRTSPEPALPSALQRSMSLSALPHGTRHPFAMTGRGHSTSDNHDDELDMIKEIIERDDPLVGPSHHHSLTNIPAELSVSLPVLHPSEGLQVLHTYNSAPAIAHSSTSRSHKTSQTAPSESSLMSGIMSGLNGTIPDFLSDSIPPHKEAGYTSDIFSYSASPSSNLHQSYTHRQSSNSTHCLHSDSSHSSTTEQKPSLTNFNPSETTSLPPHPRSPHLPVLSEILQTDPVPSSLLRSALSTPVQHAPPEKAESAHIAREAEVLCGGRGGGGVLVEERNRDNVEGGMEGGELDISVIINQHASLKGSEDVISTVNLVSTCVYVCLCVGFTITLDTRGGE